MQLRQYIPEKVIKCTEGIQISSVFGELLIENKIVNIKVVIIYYKKLQKMIKMLVHLNKFVCKDHQYLTLNNDN